MINRKSTLESRIANLEKMLKNNFKYKVNEEFDEENEEIIEEAAIFDKAIAALKDAKENIDELAERNWDQYDTEDNSYYSNMSAECSKMIKLLSMSVRNLRSTLKEV